MLGHQYDFSLKVVVVGESGVGKTSFLQRFVRDQFEEAQQPTLGVEFLTKVVKSGGNQIQLQLWDTAGQELFRSVTRGYYRGSTGAILMYDITRSETFDNIPQWINDIRSVARADITIILLGNKSDLEAERKVKKEDGEKFAKENGLLFGETSARTGDGIEEAIQHLLKDINKQIADGTLLLDKNDIEEVVFTPKEEKSCNC